MTDVTVRGIADEVYNEFSAEARRQNKSIGELTTEAMRLHPNERRVHQVSDAQELRIFRLDLEEFNHAIIFSRIEHLIFEDDIDIETF